MKSVIDRLAGDQVAIIFSDGSIITDINLTICIDAQMFAGIDIDAISVHGNARTSFGVNAISVHRNAIACFCRNSLGC